MCKTLWDSDSLLMTSSSHYCCIMMTLYKHGIEKLQRISHGGVPESTIDMIVAEYQFSLLKYVFEHASLTRWSREAYGYTIVNPYIFHGAAIALFILLPKMPTLSSAQSPGGASPIDLDRITGITSAFEECFRCLLACGMQQMLPRGIARMVYHTAQQLQVQMPESVDRMLEVAADAGWRTSDIYLVDSIYPNLATVRYSDWETREHGPRMGDLLRKWEESLLIH